MCLHDQENFRHPLLKRSYVAVDLKPVGADEIRPQVYSGRFHLPLQLCAQTIFEVAPSNNGSMQLVLPLGFLSRSHLFDQRLKQRLRF